MTLCVVVLIIITISYALSTKNLRASKLLGKAPYTRNASSDSGSAYSVPRNPFGAASHGDGE